LARVEKEALNLVLAAQILSLSYRQTKRIWGWYQEEGAEGLRHRSVGRESGRAKPKKFRQKVLRLVRKKYSGAVGNDSVRRWVNRSRGNDLDGGGGTAELDRATRSAGGSVHGLETVFVNEATQQQLLRGEAAVTQFVGWSATTALTRTG